MRELFTHFTIWQVRPAYGRHGDAVSIRRSWVHVLLVHVWDFSGNSSFLLQSKDMQIRSTNYT